MANGISFKSYGCAFIFLGALAISPSAFAHVKWFSAFGFDLKPLSISEISSPAFWGLLALSVVALPLLLVLDRKLDSTLWYQKTNQFLDRFSENSTLILRVTVAMLLLLSWQSDTMIAPEIPIPNAFWGWIQFIMVLLLLTRKTTPIVGLGMLFLYAYGLFFVGVFHLLDYIIFPAVGTYLLLSNVQTPRVKEIRLPVLYGGLGFSLCWVAFEKIIYPTWGLSVVTSQPALAMGLPPEFFLTATAFVEFTLGYLLIICFLNRPLALVITLVFFTTTLFFGKLEVIGHTILHGALLVFIIKGSGGYYPVPIHFHKTLKMRALFISGNFLLLFGGLFFAYSHMAASTFAQQHHLHSPVSRETTEGPAAEVRPTVKLHSEKDAHGGWTLRVHVENFRFTPENAGDRDIPGEGHAHLYLDGQKKARIYGEWFHVSVPKGRHTLKVELTSNSHKNIVWKGSSVASSVTVVEDRDPGMSHHHH